ERELRRQGPPVRLPAADSDLPDDPARRRAARGRDLPAVAEPERSMDWPDNPFWDYALALYRRPGVEAACLELQARHGLDVNMVLFCCWLGRRGIAPDRATLGAIAAAAERWQEAFVRPLRAVRSRLKTDLAQPRPGDVAARFPELAAALRARVLAVEIDGERLEQLLLAELAADLAPGAV